MFSDRFRQSILLSPTFAVGRTPDFNRAVASRTTGPLADREVDSPVEKPLRICAAAWVGGVSTSNRPPCRPWIGIFAELSSPKGN
jgi:hypothetical protein